MRARYRACGALLALGLGFPMLAGDRAAATPLLTPAVEAGGLRVFRDTRREGRYYYGPKGLELVSGADGEPSLRLLQMRYLGTRAAGDAGAKVRRSILSLRVALASPSPAQLRRAERLLSDRDGRRRGAAVDLRPLPLERVETALVLVSLARADGASDPLALPEGHLEAEGDEGRNTAAAYWRERRFSVRLDPATSQLVAAALERGQTLVSLAYAFFAKGATGGPSELSLGGAGDPALTELERRIRTSERRESGSPRSARDQLVLAGATALSLAPGQGERSIRRIDLNDRLPPAYAALDVFCFDFRDGRRPDLAVKTLEVEAVGVGGGAVRGRLTFEDSSPDLYAASLRFPFAVRLDRPYRYRILEVLRDGAVTRGEWRQASSWSPLLDVTSGAPAAGPVPQGRP